ncbi:alpha/beta-hydrolase [Athelia psychrophila]|uniref:Alpha/beta-hydrolase n=1 Tax=Athelia psychrophila TaxID=1759441 RepID=A0A166NVW5_9AGAM|nr:alpha/beta-hydrolase [Fibularhizoctonia sp. CBS 109695]
MAPPPDDLLPPLVICTGFLGGAGPLLWGNFDHYLNLHSAHNRKVLFAHVGQVSSLHDRACELYFALKGGVVDYGEQHSEEHAHDRYARSNPKGLYPSWSSEHPLHFFGHSLGGPTITKLQHLLSIGLFSPTDHPDMILTHTSLSAPYRGTQLVYALGERTDSAPLVRPLSVGAALTRVVHLLSYLAPLFPQGSLADLCTESRRLSYRDMSFRGLVGQLLSSEWGVSRDAAPFDVTFAASDERDRKGVGLTNKNTYYRSYVASMTQQVGQETNHHMPATNKLLFSPFYLSARLTGAFDFTSLSPVPSFLSPKGQDTNSALGQEYWQNDGVVPVFSQWHPLDCNVTQCIHHGHTADGLPWTPGRPDEEMGKMDNLAPGVWHVYELEDANHSSISPQWMGTHRQKHFWEGMGRWLADVERHRG